MNRGNLKKVFISSVFILLGFIFGLGVSVLAWVNPSQSPPLGGGVLQTDTSGLKIVTTTQITTGNFTVNNGNVGIGTTTPAAKLHLSHPSRGEIKLLATSGVGHDFGYNGGTDSAFWFTHTGTSTGYTLFRWDDGISSRNLLYIGNNGNIGIGTTNLGIINTNAAYQFVLDPDDRVLVISNSSGSTLNLENTLPLDAANVGQRLGAIVFSNTSGQADAHRQLTGIASYITGTAGSPIYTYRADLRFYTKGAAGSTESMRITDSGNVGIGTTSPTSRFHMRADYGDSDLSENRVGFRYETYFNPTVSTSTYSSGGIALLQINTPAGVTITSNDNHFSAFRPFVRKFGPGGVTKMIAVGGAWHWVNEGNIDNFYNFFGGDIRQYGGTGTVTNAYGLYLAGLKQPFVTNAYGVYQAGSSDINYFAGNVGIGTTGPQSKLHIVGASGVGRSVMIHDREIKFRGDGVAHFSIYGPDTGKSYLTIQNTSANAAPGTVGTDLLTITSGGNVGIGTTTPGTYKLRVQGTVCFDADDDGTCDSTWSDIAMKRNIQELSNALGLVNQFNPVSFEFRYDEEKFKDFFLPRGLQFGLIAQDVEKILPQLVENTVSGYKIIKYEKLVPLLVGAIKEQQKEIEELKAQILNSKH
jgi:hypothetical protein